MESTNKKKDAPTNTESFNVRTMNAFAMTATTTDLPASSEDQIVDVNMEDCSEVEKRTSSFNSSSSHPGYPLFTLRESFALPNQSTILVPINQEFTVVDSDMEIVDNYEMNTDGESTITCQEPMVFSHDVDQRLNSQLTAATPTTTNISPTASNIFNSNSESPDVLIFELSIPRTEGAVCHITASNLTTKLTSNRRKMFYPPTKTHNTSQSHSHRYFTRTIVPQGLIGNQASSFQGNVIQNPAVITQEYGSIGNPTNWGVDNRASGVIAAKFEHLKTDADKADITPDHLLSTTTNLNANLSSSISQILATLTETHQTTANIGRANESHDNVNASASHPKSDVEVVKTNARELKASSTDSTRSNKAKTPPFSESTRHVQMFDMNRAQFASSSSSISHPKTESSTLAFNDSSETAPSVIETARNNTLIKYEKVSHDKKGKENVLIWANSWFRTISTTVNDLKHSRLMLFQTTQVFDGIKLTPINSPPRVNGESQEAIGKVAIHLFNSQELNSGLIKLRDVKEANTTSHTSDFATVEEIHSEIENCQQKNAVDFNFGKRSHVNDLDAEMRRINQQFENLEVVSAPTQSKRKLSDDDYHNGQRQKVLVKDKRT
ncbi:hypothetical protein HK098_007043, partial [Nowakowskiella sp. JEL0407]